MKSSLYKKYLPLLLALLCLLMLTGCQKAAPQKTAPVVETETNREPAPESTPAPTAEPTAEPTVEPTTEPTVVPTTEPTVEPAAESGEASAPQPAAELTEELIPELADEFLTEIEDAPARDPDEVAVDWFEENEEYADYYSVTCGSNSNRGYAEFGVKNMRRQGYNPFLYTPLASPHSNCIMIGFFFTEDEARAFAEELHSVHVDGVMCEQAYAVTIRVPIGVANVYQYRDWE